MMTRTISTKLKRIVATFIDILVFFYPLSFIDSGISALHVAIFKEEMFFEYGLILGIILMYILYRLLKKKDTLIKGQYRSIGKVLMNLYIVDKDFRPVKDKDLLEKRNEIALHNSAFYILQVLGSTITENEKQTQLYVVSKKDVNFEGIEEK